VQTDYIECVRRFNRTVTQRVGALHDHYLARNHSLGASRVLWEIGDRGCEVRTLRQRLELDAGYLSRLLRGLEAEGFVEVGGGERDRRVRVARLTGRGRAERRLLDRRSDALAATLLAPLSPAQCDELVAAMSRVERLLTAALVRVDAVDPAADEAQACLQSYFVELDERFDTGFDASISLFPDVDEMRPPAGLFVVARLHDETIGCGGLKWQEGGRAYIKRMWVAPAARGLSVGRRLLRELEDLAADNGCTAVQLETNRALVEAISLYRSAGYVEVPAFNDEPYAHHWFEKHLA
jgi:DNA-binding MarR family transcriptional regulator/GNAT superfamily N-acetyltransferase